MNPKQSFSATTAPAKGIYEQVPTSEVGGLPPEMKLSDGPITVRVTQEGSARNTANPQPSIRKGICIAIGIAVVIVLGGAAAAIWYFTRGTTFLQTYEILGKTKLNADSRSGELLINPANGVQTVRFGEGTRLPLKFHSTCSLDNQRTLIKDDRFRYLCLQYSGGSSKVPNYRLFIQIVPSTTRDSGVECYDVRWDFPANDSLKDCYFSPGTQIYGGGQRRLQTWPSNLQPLINQNVVHDPFSSQGFISLVVPYWLFTTGISIMADNRKNTVFVDLNNTAVKEEGLCVGTNAKDPTSSTGTSQTLLYSLCFGDNMTHVHRSTLKKLVSTTIPGFDEAIIRKPIWTTLSMAIDEEATLDQNAVFAMAEILAEGELPASRILVDPRWESQLGGDNFKQENFPDPKELISALSLKNISAQLMMHPFLPLHSPNENDDNLQYCAKDAGNKIYNATWWLGDAAQLDFMSDTAIDWKKSRVKALAAKYALSGCRFLGGASGWLSSCCNRTLTKYWRDFHAEFSKGAVEICGENVQTEIASFFSRRILRMTDTPVAEASVEDSLNAQLRSLIPTALTISLLGHPIFIPTMVGGNPYFSENGRLELGADAEARYPNSDLFLRWLGIVLFMPVIEFSILPSYYGAETSVLEHSKTLLVIREANIDYILKAARAAANTGEPMIRPLWWNYPTDHKTWTINDQFLVGDDLLVAPIVTPGATVRQVYLPEGSWTNAQGGIESSGVVDAVAALHEVPFYFRNKS